MAKKPISEALEELRDRVNVVEQIKDDHKRYVVCWNEAIRDGTAESVLALGREINQRQLQPCLDCWRVELNREAEISPGPRDLRILQDLATLDILQLAVAGRESEVRSLLGDTLGHPGFRLKRGLEGAKEKVDAWEQTGGAVPTPLLKTSELISATKSLGGLSRANIYRLLGAGLGGEKIHAFPHSAFPNHASFQHDNPKKQKKIVRAVCNFLVSHDK